MEDSATRTQHELNLAARKVEEAAWRRSQATQWLDSLVGPLGISKQPSEREFISCLRSGRVLCNAINKIRPGSVQKVVENHLPSQSPTWDSQPLPAYQYFENVRNFLVAAEELKLTTFEAPVLERDNLEAGSSAKVVDCILELKAFHEWKQMTGGNGFYKPQRSPFVIHSAAKNHSHISGVTTLDPHRRLDMNVSGKKETHSESDAQKIEELIVAALAECMVDKKENIDANLLASFRRGNPDAINLLRKTMSSCLQEQLQNRLPEVKPAPNNQSREECSSITHSKATKLVERSSILGTKKCCRACLNKGYCSHHQLFKMQEKELVKLKSLLSRTKVEFEDLQSQLQADMKQLESQVQEMSMEALGYHKVVKENMNLYNMVQDLKGTVRVYCRIRPSFDTEAKDVINFIEDGSLGISDPLKPLKDGRRVFRFDRVFGPTATQADVFRVTQPLIKSLMDGYNVCMFAYGQTGSGKTHTMFGSSGSLTEELGISYRALDDLFQLVNDRKDIIKYDIHLQMVEIYNENVRDLLVEDSRTTKLDIRSCTSLNSLGLPGASMHSVTSTGDVLDLVKFGEVNRVVSSSAFSDRSSRSHSILTVHVHGEDISGSRVRSCLHLVDLAGSECVDESEVTGDRLGEAQYINKSLSCLGDVITALAQKNSQIPYGNSKLTLLLQNSLGRHAKTLMFAHISPEEDYFAETVRTLKFGQRVSTVELGAPRPQRENNEVLELKKQLESLKRALSNKELQSAEVNVLKENKSPLENSKSVTKQTPSRPRRLSIEPSSAIRREKVQANKPKKTRSFLSNASVEITPPPRRLSIENRYTPKMEKSPRTRRLSIGASGIVKMEKAHEIKSEEAKYGSEEAQAIAERTSHGSQRSIETCNSTKMEKAADPEDKKALKTPSVQTRGRRLSIENCNSTKIGKRADPEDKKVLKTPSVQTRGRRLSIENCNSEMRKTEDPEDKKVLKTPSIQTRGRRLSIENCNSTKMGKAADSVENKVLKTPVQTRARRLSLEGPKYVNKDSINLERSVLPQTASSTSKPRGFNSNGDFTLNRSRQTAPKSPLNSVHGTQVVRLETPEPTAFAKSELVEPLKSQTTSMNFGANGKASQIRKSLRAIGKLITGSDKRNQHKQMETPFNNASGVHDMKSPVAHNARALRRRSLAGLQPLDVSVRSNGGNSNGYCTSHAKTPPPVPTCAKSPRRWL